MRYPVRIVLALLSFAAVACGDDVEVGEGGLCGNHGPFGDNEQCGPGLICADAHSPGTCEKDPAAGYADYYRATHPSADAGRDGG